MYTKLIVAILAFLIIAGVGYTLYSKGQLAAQQECAAKFEQYQKEVDAKVQQLESNLAVITATSLHQQLSMNTDITEILKRIKTSPVTVVKNGKCYPSPTFVEGINQAVDRANKR